MSAQHSIVSVVITCYNQAHFLSEAIDSVLAQSYEHIEINVIDDGSKDNPAEVAARYPSVRYLRQTNQGVAVARNRGLSESTGDYIVFLDADDRLPPDAFAINAGFLEARSGCAFVSGNCKHIDVHGNTLQLVHRPSIESEHYVALLRSNYILMPAQVMYRRALLDSIGGFDASVDHGSDFELYLRIARDFPVYHHDKIVAEWRQHETNTSRNSSLMLKCSLAVMRAQGQHLKADERRSEAYKTGIGNFKYLYGEQLAHEVRMHFRERKEWKQAARKILLLLRYYPQGLAGHAKRKLSSVVGGFTGKRSAV